MATVEGNSRNEIGHWANDEIGLAVQSWLWVRVELMAWQLSRLERLNGIQYSWVQIPIKPTFYSFLSAVAVVWRHCASPLFIHSSYLVIHPLFISVNYSHPIAAEVLIVYLRTVNCIVKLYFKIFYYFCIYYPGCLILI